MNSIVTAGGARTGGRATARAGPPNASGETPRVADSSAAGAGRFFHNSVPPSKQNRLGTPNAVDVETRGLRRPGARSLVICQCGWHPPQVRARASGVRH